MNLPPIPVANRRRAQGNWGDRLGTRQKQAAAAAAADAEGLHQMRAAIRHRRPMQVLFKDRLEPQAAAWLEAAFRRLGSDLGRGA